VLADPDVPREPLDELKYIRLSDGDARTYLSLGANIRERFEVNDANFGTGSNQQDSYLLSRTEAHADLRMAGQVQMFLQLQSATALEKAKKNASRWLIKTASASSKRLSRSRSLWGMER
jgi:Alginate export